MILNLNCSLAESPEASYFASLSIKILLYRMETIR